jgi:hypothetical protein
LTIIRVCFVEDLRLSQLDVFVCVAKVNNHVADEMLAVHISHYFTAKISRLYKVTEQKPLKSTLAVASFLSKLGFSLQLLSSEQ